MDQQNNQVPQMQASNRSNIIGFPVPPPGFEPQVPKAASSRPHTTFEGDGTVKNLPMSMLADQFGIAGFMVGRKAKFQGELPDQVSDEVFTEMEHHVLRRTLTGNTSELLLNSFPGPSGKATEPLFFFTGPESPFAEYDMTSRKFRENSEVDVTAIRQTLALKPNVFADDLLFFLFYNFPRDILQLIAAEKLYMNGWRYHMEARLWLRRVENCNYTNDIDPGTGAQLEKGIYKYFNNNTWKEEQVECVLDFRKLEGKPSLPKDAFLPEGKLPTPTPGQGPSQMNP